MGSGVGLQIVAEFVGNAYGLTPARAFEKRLVMLVKVYLAFGSTAFAWTD